MKDTVQTSRSFRAEVMHNGPVNASHRLITLRPLSEARAPRPGQFYMVGTGAFPEPLLKRPLCFFEGGADAFSMLYKVAGKGTTLLANTPEGAVLEVLGPLGNFYPAPPAGKVPVVVAGGIGIASVYPLLAAMPGRAITMYGACTKDDLMYVEQLSAMSKELHISTDDGSCGAFGNVINLLEGLGISSGHVIYACGPRPMLGAVAGFSRERGIAGYASLEEHMACGIGACMGCVVRTVHGYRRVCKEGPVFRMEELA